ncbi:MAG TPA: DUF3108 domain-containing protein [Sunxiuqinia sp.]|nr:DUF3108 domain-containing protein [Sunxiuqinia sp.]
MKLFLIAVFFLCISIVQAQPTEELKYSMRYSFFKGGEATLSIEDTVYNGKKAEHFVLDGNTVGLADVLFEVHDVYESIVNPETYLPYKATRNIQEGNYNWYNEAYFYHDQDSLYSLKSGGHHVPGNTVDFVTAFFYMVNSDLLDQLKRGQEFKIPVYHADQFFMMRVQYLGKERIKSKLGKKVCHVIRPRIDKGKVLNSSDGLKFYITNDEARIPLMLEFDLKVGALKCELYSYKINGVEQIN